jgi:hypothetical protein
VSILEPLKMIKIYNSFSAIKVCFFVLGCCAGNCILQSTSLLSQGLMTGTAQGELVGN